MFKRNQVEEAIAIVLEGATEPSDELRTRIKRLLDTDRALGRNKRSADPEVASYAFYSVEAPGRGSENWFSDYEAFALLTGLRLMRHGWPQGFAVAALRRVKSDLALHHGRILQQDPAVLFDQKLISQQAKPGDLVFTNADPVFLAILPSDRDDRSYPNRAVVCRGQTQLVPLFREQDAWTAFELVNSAHALSDALEKTAPRKRGRASE